MAIINIQLWQKFVGFIFILSLSSVVYSQENNIGRKIKSHQVPRIDSAINVDAVMDEEIWEQALKFELNYETNPAENTKPPVETEVYIYEDGKTIYVAFIAHDPNPEKIRAYLADRDAQFNGDLVGIKFDTFDESRKAFQFFVNPLGVQTDMTQEDFRSDNKSWNTIWDSAGEITDTGYIVEIAIPFKSLRFPEGIKKQQWGFEALRFYPRNYTHRIANTPVNRNVPCRICQFDKLEGFTDLKPSQNLMLTPTLVVGQSETRNDAFEPWKNSGTDSEVGLDFRWGVTQDIVLNATLNPDFSQVEADAAKININDPFSLFLSEERPFFLDGQDYFITERRLVHTRNIVAPDYGVKVTGQSNSHSFGIMAVNDEHTNIIIPGKFGSKIYEARNQKSDNQVFRYSYDLGNKNNLGVMLTQRSSDDYKNQVFSFDGKYWFDQYHSFTLQAMFSDTKNPQALIDEYSTESDYQQEENMSGNAIIAKLTHESRNWRGNLLYFEFKDSFRADLGFINRVDYDKTILGLERKWFPEKKNSWWTEISLFGDVDRTNDNDGIKLEEEAELRFRLRGLLQSNLFAGIEVRSKLWANQYFDEKEYHINYDFQPIGDLTIRSGINWGDKIDFTNNRLGEQVRISSGIEWQINNQWRTSLDINHIDFDSNNRDLFIAQSSNFRMTYQLNLQSFIRLTLQSINIDREVDNYLSTVNSTYKSLGTQLLYSYKVNPQTLFFAGYSDNGYQNDLIDNIEKVGRSVFMKFSYAWQI